MIVITAPTGRIGRQVLAGVLSGGGPVRVIARDPARLAPEVRERVEVVRGTHADPGVLDEAFAGADAVFWLLPPDPRAEDIDGHMRRFTEPACEAFVKQQVKRVVGVSSLGRGTAENAGQISAALAMDQLIEDTGVGYRALCMPGFMENMLQQVGTLRSDGTFFMTLPADLKLPTCATRDIAAVATGLLLDPSWHGQEGVPVLGPEDLSPDDMAHIMSEVLDRPIRYQRVPADAYKAMLVQHGVAECWAQGLVDMADEVERGIYRAESRASRVNAPTTFRQWCADVLRPAVHG